jgi:hypothetical protein
MGSRLFTNLMARCDNIAVAMAARGFQGPQRHVLYPMDLLAAPTASMAAGTTLPPPAASRLPAAADLAMLACLALLAGISYAVV